MAQWRAGGLVVEMEHPSKNPNKRQIDKKKVVSWIGTILMVASLVFLGRRLFIYNDDFDASVFLSARVAVGLIIVTLFEGLGILLAGTNFRSLVKNVSGVLVERPLAMVVYTLSNLYKYIPGGVMYVVGRNRLAVETEELSHPQVALSTVLEGIIIAFAAIILVLITVFNQASEYLRQEELPTVLVIIIIIILVIAGSVAFSFRSKLKEGSQKLFEHMRVLSISVLIKRFGFGLLLMTFWGGTFLATLMVLGQPLTISQWPTVIGLFLLSWLAGFLTPGAPSGLGIREVVMLAFMGNMLNEEILLSAMIVHRIVAAAGDIAAYGLAMGYAHIAKNKK